MIKEIFKNWENEPNKYHYYIMTIRLLNEFREKYHCAKIPYNVDSFDVINKVGRIGYICGKLKVESRNYMLWCQKKYKKYCCFVNIFASENILKIFFSDIGVYDYDNIQEFISFVRGKIGKSVDYELGKKILDCCVFYIDDMLINSDKINLELLKLAVEFMEPHL